MTDNRVLLSEDGREAVFVSRADGLAVAVIKEQGVLQAILSTETNPVVSRRAEKLQIPVVQSVGNKAAVLQQFAIENQVSLDKTVFVGNDINDLAAMNLVRYPVAPSDAHHSVKAIACHVTQAPGGHGVIRELIDDFLEL